MNKPKIALLIDLASLRISCEGFKKLAEKISADFEIVNCNLQLCREEKQTSMNT